MLHRNGIVFGSFVQLLKVDANRGFELVLDRMEQMRLLPQRVLVRDSALPKIMWRGRVKKLLSFPQTCLQISFIYQLRWLPEVDFGFVVRFKVIFVTVLHFIPDSGSPCLLAGESLPWAHPTLLVYFSPLWQKQVFCIQRFFVKWRHRTDHIFQSADHRAWFCRKFNVCQNGGLLNFPAFKGSVHVFFIVPVSLNMLFHFTQASVHALRKLLPAFQLLLSLDIFVSLTRRTISQSSLHALIGSYIPKLMLCRMLNRHGSILKT